jgi:hypothetical protein
MYYIQIMRFEFPQFRLDFGLSGIGEPKSERCRSEAVDAFAVNLASNPSNEQMEREKREEYWLGEGH